MQATVETVTTYAYDQGGNLTTVTEKVGDAAAVTTKEFEYGNGAANPDWNDQLTKVNGQILTYDAIGNLFNDGASTYRWQKGSQLKSIEGAVNAEYEYDYTGLRRSKTTGGVRTEFVWVGGLLMASVSPTQTIAWSYDQDGKMLGFSLKTNNTSIDYFYLRNLQGDVVGICDASGNVVARYEYDAWGSILTGGEEGIGKLNPIRYRGYYWDAETGFYYCQSRYYNPKWCRWISADVYFDTQDGIMGTNMYCYVQNNPVIYCDSQGTALELALAGVGAAGGAIGTAAAVGGANAWNPVGWVIITGVAIVAIGFVSYEAYQLYQINQTIQAKQYANILGNLPGFKTLKIETKHILENHGPNGNKPQKDKFPAEATATLIAKWIEEAYNSGKLEVVKEQFDKKNGWDIVQLKGFSESLQSYIVMYLNLTTGTITTAYPK